MKESETVVRRSVLDRLIQTGEPEPRTQADSVRAVRAAVLRDVEWLLNTRRIHLEAPAHLTELHESVYFYGIPDITSLSADSPSVRSRVLRWVADAIERFEPRLAAVRVNELPADENSRQVRFQVEALLQLPVPEAIYFDTVLDPTSGRFRLTAAL
jgi:type VI secretion system protein ImpF